MQRYKGKVQLIFTSPPFPLNRKKKYGNLSGEAYLKWLSGFAELFKEFLKPNGSIVLELGNAWEQRNPTMSTLAIRALLGFLTEGKLKLCQQFVCYNSARLPTPVPWVNIERIRVKDAFTHLWWMAKTERPKADNRRVLIPYSSSMRRLLATGKYNSGRRPSGHHIGRVSFLKDNGGAIPSNVITTVNTVATDKYSEYCRNNDLSLHPARMPDQVAAFFIKFLTDPGDLVLDPFGGSNTTGAVAEELDRRWLSIESNMEYAKGSMGRFGENSIKADPEMPRTS
jgi:site-specific DNA-methyltransferase (cytosine-N4-specific)